MHSTKLSALAAGLFVTLEACSGPAGAPPEPVVLPSGDAPSGAGSALAYFDGSVDVANHTMTVVTRTAGGSISSQQTIPYGDNPGQFYFHTCSTTPITTTYGGMVQGVNLGGADTTHPVNAVIDSVSETGVTLASGSGAGGTSGIIATYASVPGGTPDCSTSQAWTFNVPGPANFTFKGHVDGSPALHFAVHLGGGYVRIPGSATLNDRTLYTLEGWISPDNVAIGYEGLLSQDHGGCCTIRMLVASNGSQFVNAGAHNDVGFGGFTFGSHVWTHWAMTCSGGVAKTWFNGVLAGTTTCFDPGDMSTAPMYLGAGEGGNSYRLTGRLAEMRISNVARYTGTFTPTKRFTSDANTMMLQHFDTGSGTTTLDSSGNGNNGTFTGGTVTWVTDDR